MTRRARWTPELVEQAKSLRLNGATYPEIDAEFGFTKGATWQKLNADRASPEAKERQREYMRDYMRNRRGGVSRQPPRRVEVPLESLIDRDMAEAAPRDLTASIMGDPPPHRSALARKVGVHR